MKTTYEINHADITQFAPVANWIQITGVPTLSDSSDNREFRRGLHALGFELVGKVHNQDRIFGYQSHQHNQPQQCE